MLGFPRSYQRTCRECGYAWTLSRWQAKLRPGLHPVVGWAVVVGRESDRGQQVAGRERSVEADAEAIARLVHCARCGSKRYTQRPLKRPSAAAD